MLWPVRWHATIDEGQHATISMTVVANRQKNKLQTMGQNAVRSTRTSLNFSGLSFSKPIYIITSMLWTTIWVNLALLALAHNVNYKKQMCTKSNSWKNLLYGIFPARCLRLVVKALLFKMRVQWNWYLRPHVKAFFYHFFLSSTPLPSLSPCLQIFKVSLLKSDLYIGGSYQNFSQLVICHIVCYSFN